MRRKVHGIYGSKALLRRIPHVFLFVHTSRSQVIHFEHRLNVLLSDPAPELFAEFARSELVAGVVFDGDPPFDE
jgi:hypothetical protein